MKPSDYFNYLAQYKGQEYKNEDFEIVGCFHQSADTNSWTYLLVRILDKPSGFNTLTNFAFQRWKAQYKNITFVDNINDYINKQYDFHWEYFDSFTLLPNIKQLNQLIEELNEDIK